MPNVMRRRWTMAALACLPDMSICGASSWPPRCLTVGATAAHPLPRTLFRHAHRLVRYMSNHSAMLSRMHMMDALDYSLRRCCWRDAAWWCHRNCGYF